MADDMEMSSKDHQQKTIRFFRDNRVDEKQHKTGDFILDSDQINSFKEKAELCIRKFEQKQEEEIQKGAQNIYNTAIKSRYIHQSGYQQSLSEQKFSARTQGGSTNQKGRRFVRSTISAYGEGLTFIGVQWNKRKRRSYLLVELEQNLITRHQLHLNGCHLLGEYGIMGDGNNQSLSLKNKTKHNRLEVTLDGLNLIKILKVLYNHM
ncbi:hypothetical protein KUTeg_006120 [Tegillarca granosa]|uniref:Uncharacterized protein n=1 Tax=Tegillarca granosa TaxID=220873 RepID=A0ABQ9FIU9_TEGGR|nr:hypothetical protein KUTeg_006120 [Tegillarca granosa]